jgi:DNA-binding PadR family transcriptional regulator
MAHRLAALTAPGIAILSLLWRQPMHPYEMRHRIRVQEIDRVMKVTHGTLYSTVDRLTATGLIQPIETSRDGRRPERTVYEITDPGRDQLFDAIRDGLMRPKPDYPSLAISLTFASLLEPAEVARLLDRRRVETESYVSGMTAAVEASLKSVTHQEYGLPRVHLIEAEYLIALRRAELDWLNGVVEDIHAGRLTWDPSAPVRSTGAGDDNA